MKATAVPSLQGESLVPSSESLYQEPEALRQHVLLERQRPQALFAHVFSWLFVSLFGGNKVCYGKELFQSVLVCLLLIIFSLFLAQ